MQTELIMDVAHWGHLELLTATPEGSPRCFPKTRLGPAISNRDHF